MEVVPHNISIHQSTKTSWILGNDKELLQTHQWVAATPIAAATTRAGFAGAAEPSIQRMASR